MGTRTIRRLPYIGEARGIIIPKLVWSQLGLEREVVLELQDDGVVVRPYRGGELGPSQLPRPLRLVGTSYGIIIPKTVLATQRFEEEVVMEIQADHLVLRRPEGSDVRLQEESCMAARKVRYSRIRSPAGGVEGEA